ncbi:MAG: hypothetical protein U0Y10_25290 [Spirosomataceae bacterium]
MIRVLCLILFIVCQVKAQTITKFRRDSLFLNHLMEIGEHKNAITLIGQLQRYYADSLQQRLELSFQKGLAYYTIKQLDSAEVYLIQTPSTSKNHVRAQFLGGISATYLHKYLRSAKYFDAIRTDDTVMFALRNFEYSGLALLKRDFNAFDSLSRVPLPSHYSFEKQQEAFTEYKQSILKQRKKSPLLAGVMSAIVPGSGKIYVGQLGQGIAALFQTAFLGLQAYEGYRKDGPTSARFLIYGGLFSLFYVGNVWGSVLSVRIQQREFNDKVNEQIIFDMHIPIRTIFN